VTFPDRRLAKRHPDVVADLENYVGSAKAVRIMLDAVNEINRLRDEVERLYAAGDALMAWVGHDIACESALKQGGSCTCGLQRVASGWDNAYRG